MGADPIVGPKRAPKEDTTSRYVLAPGCTCPETKAYRFAASVGELQNEHRKQKKEKSYQVET